MKYVLLGIQLFFSITVVGTLPAAEWGNVKGQFLYDGNPPEPAKLRITKDEEECCKHELVDESLVVNGENHGLKNVVIYLYQERGVTVRAAGKRTVAEEMPYAYKDVADVVEVMAGAGVSEKVFRLKPLGVIKG